MRTIEFRGKQIDRDGWVFGDLIHGVGAKHGRMYILPRVVNLATLPGCHHLDGYEVIPETVGQMVCKIKRDDCSVDEIFEHDLIVHGERVLKVMVLGGNTSLVGKDETTAILLSFNEGKVKVGNIHDNPELITN